MLPDSDGDFDGVTAEMTEALDEVQTGEITTAVRDADIDGVAVQEGEIISLFNRKLVFSATNLEAACLGLLEKANAVDYELITLFYGSDVSKHDANHIADSIRTTYPDLDIELQDGGQPHYQFIISIE
jgi:dihydroxyacetone kinase-like predicted kinase